MHCYRITAVLHRNRITDMFVRESLDYILAEILVASVQSFHQIFGTSIDPMSRRVFEWPVFNALGFASLIPPPAESNGCTTVTKLRNYGPSRFRVCHIYSSLG